MIDITINSKTIIIHAKRRQGKSLFTSVYFAPQYDRIYSNFHIYRDGKSIVNYYNTYDYFDTVEFSNIPGLLIVDEAGQNFATKTGKTKENEKLRKFMNLSGKYNLSLIFIAQSYENVEIDARRQVDFIFEVSKILMPGGQLPLFEVTQQREVPIGETGYYLETIRKKTIDLFELKKIFNISYDQLEQSQLN